MSLMNAEENNEERELGQRFLFSQAIASWKEEACCWSTARFGLAETHSGKSPLDAVRKEPY